jgi:hypothetical protein
VPGLRGISADPDDVRWEFVVRIARQRVVDQDRAELFLDCLGEKGQWGIVKFANVLESEKKVYYTVVAEDDANHIFAEPISDEALADYKAHPAAFFGAIQRVGRRADTAYELFEFFLDGYRATPKERLLELMQGWRDIERLRGMEQADLAIEYAEGYVTSFLNRDGKGIHRI